MFGTQILNQGQLNRTPSSPPSGTHSAGSNSFAAAAPQSRDPMPWGCASGAPVTFQVTLGLAIAAHDSLLLLLSLLLYLIY